jgi:murein DD-endopeptidase MepM/ murein hydrolase activator NlpD
MNTRKRVLTIVVLGVALLSMLVWRLTRTTPRHTIFVLDRSQTSGAVALSSPSQPTPEESSTPFTLTSPEPSPLASEIIPAPTPTPTPTPAPTPSATTTPVPVTSPPSYTPSSKLIIPVAGVRPEQLQDTFTDARSEGRVHDAIDIIAPMGTPVLAAADGKIVKLFHSDRGGITIYQLDPDNKTIYYYAHLDRYADGIAEGKVVRQGETIAYVGDTGNAGAGNYHLHFSISLVSDPKRYWDGVNINPYPLLTGKQ